MPLKIDHVVVGATQLKLAGPEMKELMGVSVPPGGKHPAMSTHNQVMQSGNDTFFEIIAIDPNAPAFP
ncbi:MAG: VOC family protein, partial [Pseudomonadota bacterium]